MTHLKRYPELLSFLSTYFADSDPEKDRETAQAFVKTSQAGTRFKVIEQIKEVVSEAELPVDEFGSEANRWFGDSLEARAWLEALLGVLEDAQSSDLASASGALVKDSNGTALSEGDSVQVIKDLKVKGGSSDLKRGTTIKKIHLIDDPEVVECRVDGSTLVLKTCFLKKV